MIHASGLFETHLTVRDVQKSIAFYRDIVGLALAYDLPARNAAFMWIGGRGKAMLGLWGIGSSPLTQTLHLAFEMALDDLLSAPQKLRAAGITPLGFDGEAVSEPVVIGWMPAVSLYFKDPDGHMLEYLAMLPNSPDSEVGIVSYRDWGIHTSLSGIEHKEAKK